MPTRYKVSAVIRLQLAPKGVDSRWGWDSNNDPVDRGPANLEGCASYRVLGDLL